MGRAIDMEKDIDTLKREVERLKKAFEGLASTVDTLKIEVEKLKKALDTLQLTSPARRNVDLHKETKPKKSKTTKKVKLVEETQV